MTAETDPGFALEYLRDLIAEGLAQYDAPGPTEAGAVADVAAARLPADLLRAGCRELLRLYACGILQIPAETELLAGLRP